MGRVVIPILWFVMAVAVAFITLSIANEGFGIAADTIREDALRGAGCVFAALVLGTLIRVNK
jgi:hypothetical protein